MDLSKMIKNNTLDYNKLIDQINYPLHYLAYNSKTNLIKMIPKSIMTEYVCQENLEGDTIGHITAKLGNTQLFEYIVPFCAVIYQLNHLGLSPLYYLVKQIQFIKKFVKKNEIKDHWIAPNQTLLDYYVVEKNLEMVKYLLDHIKIGPHSIFTIIESDLSTSNKIKLLKLFIQKGIDLSVLNQQTYLSPLIMATFANDNKLVDFLLKNGADPNYSGPENTDNVLTIAIFYENDKIINTLLNYHIQIDIQNKYMQTPIHYMYIYRKKIPTSTKKKLLFDLNVPDNQMNTILSLLIQNDDWKLYVSILEQHKLDIYLANKEGKMPIDYVPELEKEDFYQLVYRSYLNQLDKDHDWEDDMDNIISKFPEQKQKKYIMNKIINLKTSFPHKKSNIQSIRILNPPKTNITHFSANNGNCICFLYYILKKYPDIKIPLLAPDQITNKKLKNYYAELTKNFSSDSPLDKSVRSIIKDYINHSPVLANHLIIWKNSEKYFFSPYIIQGISQTLKSYSKTKLILLKLTIIENNIINHANILIVDMNRKTIEHFDPYGKVPFINSDAIDQLLRTFFKDYLPTFKYLGIDELFNGISFQVYSDENSNHLENDPVGFCLAWCYWYIEMRIQNMDVDPVVLITETIKQLNKSKSSFKDYIRDYSNYLDTEKNHIMELTGVPNNYWYAQEFPVALYQSYIKNIRKLFGKIL
jgi:ankyrin repeat protein